MAIVKVENDAVYGVRLLLFACDVTEGSRSIGDDGPLPECPRSALYD